MKSFLNNLFICRNDEKRTSVVKQRWVNPLSHPLLKINSIDNGSMVNILKLLSCAMAKVSYSLTPSMVTNFHQAINAQVFESVVKK